MPKISKSAKAAKKASQRTPTTKLVRFTFEGQQFRAAINLHDTATDIYYAFHSQLPGIGSEIEIVDEQGVKLPLGYTHVKDNGKVHVRKVEKRMQGAGGAGRGPQTVMKSLAKIVHQWGLESPSDIFPPDCAPRRENLDGEKATSADTMVPILAPESWSAKFTVELLKLSAITFGQYDQAMGAMRLAARKRQRNGGLQHQHAGEITKADVVAATKWMREDLGLAGDAVNVLDTKKYVGELDEALELVEEGLDVEGREDDFKGTHFVLPLHTAHCWEMRNGGEIGAFREQF